MTFTERKRRTAEACRDILMKNITPILRGASLLHNRKFGGVQVQRSTPKKDER